MSKFEVFNDEEQLFRRIDQLRIDDIKDEDITVVSDDRLDNHAIIYYTSVNFKKSHGTLWDRFASKFGDDDANTRVTETLNLSEDDQVKYDKALDEGSILLFVKGLSHTEEVAETHEDDTDSSKDASREAAEDEGIKSKTDSISDDEEKRSDEMIIEKERETVTKDYGGITVTTEVDEKKDKSVNVIRTDEDTHRIDMSTYVTDFDEDLELEEEEVQHAEVDAILEEEEEIEEEENHYHTVKDNVVNMQPEEDEDEIRQG